MNKKIFETSLIINDIKGSHVVIIEQIRRLEARGNSAVIYLKDGTDHLVSEKLKYLLLRFDPEIFFRTHRSHAVNRKEIECWDKGNGGYITLLNGHKVPIAVLKKPRFRKWIKEIAHAHT